ncbi:MAG: DinB family protein [Phycisphaerae bacterium]|nr:DinB family protein [Phycisphaerae bacterium]
MTTLTAQHAPPLAPKLALPGAGLPAIELLVGRALFAIRRWRATRATFTNEFLRERDASARLRQPLSDLSRGQRVLIPRLRGLEDSSRFWSVWMTLDHLRIVHVEIARVIDALSRDTIPEGKVSTAAVKPSPDVGGEVEEQYEQSCDRLLATVAAMPELHPRLGSRLGFAHPWFGPLDAAGWHALAAMHMAIHRSQIERITRELPRDRQ